MKKKNETKKKTVKKKSSKKNVKKKLPKTGLQSFFDYVWGYYAPNEVYSCFFDNNLTRTEVGNAIYLYISRAKNTYGGGDTLDREIVRDIMLNLRGVKKTEHVVRSYI